MHNDFDPEENQNDEIPEELRSMSKSKLYNSLKSEFLMPSKECRRLSKLYCARVRLHVVFRVELHLILQFEANLIPDEKVRSSFLNIDLLVQRLNLLLEQIDELTLGFNPSALPDVDWSLRVCRYHDRSNILSFYRRPVRNAPRLHVPAAEM